MKRLIVFDLDGTLAESKSPLDAEMATLLGQLLAAVPVAIISGGDWPQFATQLLTGLARDAPTANLSLLPPAVPSSIGMKAAGSCFIPKTFSLPRSGKSSMPSTRHLRVRASRESSIGVI